MRDVVTLGVINDVKPLGLGMPETIAIELLFALPRVLVCMGTEGGGLLAAIMLVLPLPDVMPSLTMLDSLSPDL